MISAKSDCVSQIIPTLLNEKFLLFRLVRDLFCILQDQRKTTAGPSPSGIRPFQVASSFTELFIDTTALERYVQARSMQDTLVTKMQSFYNRRNYQFAWFFPDGMAEFVHTFLSLQNDYIHDSGDS